MRLCALLLVIPLSEGQFADTNCGSFDTIRAWLISHNQDMTSGRTNVQPSAYFGNVAGVTPGYYTYASTGPYVLQNGIVNYDWTHFNIIEGASYTDIPGSNKMSYVCYFAGDDYDCTDNTVTMWGYQGGYQCGTLVAYGKHLYRMQFLFRCPDCTANAFSANCGGRDLLQRTPQEIQQTPFCIPCAFAPPENGLSVSPAIGSTVCGNVVCPAGYTAATATSGTVDAASPMGACQPCPISLPANAVWPMANLNGLGFCAWQCNAGYSYDAMNQRCAACWRPSGSILTQVPGTWGGQRNTDCSGWVCPPTTYYSSTTFTCVTCAVDTFQNVGTNTLVASCPSCYANWRTAPASGVGLASSCNAGFYPVFSLFDCTVYTCAACAATTPAGTYYVKDGLSATASGACITAQCPTTSDAGYQYLGCGGTSPGYRTACTNLPIWVGDAGNTNIPNRYYTQGCATAACTPCTASNQFNAGCPTKNGLSTYDNGCVAACTPTSIENGYYLAVASRNAPIPSTKQCPFACNAGFQASLTDPVCLPCQNSSACNPVGQYMQTCNGACYACTTYPLTGSATYQWLRSYPLYGEQASCNWQCNQGFYKSSASVCAVCGSDLTVCSKGTFLWGACLAGPGAISNSQCILCNGVANASLSTRGLAANNADSCGFQCNTGFFSTGARVCVPWSSGNCGTNYSLYWGGGTPLNDQSCVVCANLPTSGAYVTFLSPCVWTCASRAYLSGTALCLQCPPGTFKNFTGAGPCTPCPAWQYQNSNGADSCLDLPSNSTRTADASGFKCLASFVTQTTLSNLPGCVACVTGAYDAASAMRLSHMSSASWGDGSCQLTAFACVSGYYRVAGGTCAPCPLVAGALTGAGTPTVRCGAVPSCPSPADELTAACPPTTTGCAPWYYGQVYFPDANASLQALRCVACATVACPGGTYAAPCQNGQSVNPCTSCAGTLGTGQVWGVGCTTLCSAGYGMASNGACVACSAGYFQPNAAACTACPHGSYIDVGGATACSACGSGLYAPDQITNNGGGASACLQCALGTYSSGGVSACVACAANTFAAAVGLSACTTCPPETPYAVAGSTACALPPYASGCPPGFYGQSAICTVCPAGTYCVGGGAMPTYCPMGTPPAPRLSSSWVACNRSWLTPGYRTTGALPAPCPANTTTYTLTGATSIDWCYPMPGYYGSPGVPCPYDSYCPPPAWAPTPCPANTFAPLMSTSASACISAMRQPCRPGYFVPWNGVGVPSVNCTQCKGACYCPGQVLPNGTAVPPATPSGSNVLPCPDASATGAWNSNPGATAASACFYAGGMASACGSNTGSLVATVTSPLQCRALAGYYFLPGYDTIANPCPVGYFCPAYGSEPIPCAQNVTCAAGAMPTSQPCPKQSVSQGPVCQTCAVALPATNAYWASPGVTCDVCCAAGFYLATVAQALTCIPQSWDCTPSAYAYRPSTPACYTSVPACIACPPSPVTGGVASPPASGAFDVQACRYRCPTGYCSTLGAPTFNGSATGACTITPLGYYAVNGTCTACPVGTYLMETGATVCRVCPDYSTAVATVGAYLCPCNAGFYAAVTNNNTQTCAPCPAGTVSPPNSLQCSTCLAGTSWTPQAAWTLWGTCAQGTFRATPLSACQPCGAGKFSDAQEATVCRLCAAGTYAPNTSLTACALCANSTYASGTGRSYCAACPTNASSSASNGTRCACPVGQFMETNSQCVACASRCPANNSRVVPLRTGSSGCTLAGVDATDFACACAAGYYGDGITSCAACANRTACQCPAGSYFDGARCQACQTCPAVANLTSPCLSGSTSDTSQCICPTGHYFRWGDCFPCSSCAPFATLIAPCPLGSTRDATRCLCRPGWVGNGIVACTCPPLTYYQASNGTCAQCATCSPNATTLATCAAGATNDTTRCACLSGYQGNGFTCL